MYMKILRLLTFCCLSVFYFHTAIAQQVNPNAAKILTTPKYNLPDAARPLPTTTRPDRVTIFEQQNFVGRQAKYAQTTEPFVYPFANKRNISLKVEPGYIAYIKFDNDFKDEIIFKGNHPNFGEVYRYDILSIKVVQGTLAYINFAGISLPIPNNDCRKIWGDIIVRVFEKRNEEMLLCPVAEENGTGFATQATGATIYQNSSIDGFSPFFQLNNYIFENSQPSNVPEIRTWPTSTKPYIGARFLVSMDAMRSGNIFVEVTPNLRLGHKSNDFATDYSDNITIKQPLKDLINYQEAPTFFSTVPFTAKGNPNFSVEASGVDYKIIKTVRIHLNKQPSRY